MVVTRVYTRVKNAHAQVHTGVDVHGCAELCLKVSRPNGFVPDLPDQSLARGAWESAPRSREGVDAHGGLPASVAQG